MQSFNIIDIRDTHLYNHLSFTNPDQTPIETIKRLIHKIPYDMQTLSLNKFLRIPIENKQVICIKRACMWADVPIPDAIHAIHVCEMSNVKKVSLCHKEVGVVFSKDIDCDYDSDDYESEVGIPMAFSYTNPQTMFCDTGENQIRLSVIPCMPRFDSTGDWTFVLDPEDPSKPATACATLGSTYINPLNQNPVKKALCSPKSTTSMVYYMNGKEIAATVHELESTDYVYSSDDGASKEEKSIQWYLCLFFNLSIWLYVLTIVYCECVTGET